MEHRRQEQLQEMKSSKSEPVQGPSGAKGRKAGQAYLRWMEISGFSIFISSIDPYKVSR